MTRSKSRLWTIVGAVLLGGITVGAAGTFFWMQAQERAVSGNTALPEVQPTAVRLTVEPFVKDGELWVRGNTNAPDGTVLSVSGWAITVRNGRYSGRVPYRVVPDSPTQFEVVMRPAYIVGTEGGSVRAQNEDFQRLFGRSGELMGGSLVRPGKNGTQEVAAAATFTFHASDNSLCTGCLATDFAVPGVSIPAVSDSFPCHIQLWSLDRRGPVYASFSDPTMPTALHHAVFPPNHRVSARVVCAVPRAQGKDWGLSLLHGQSIQYGVEPMPLGLMPGTTEFPEDRWTVWLTNFVTPQKAGYFDLVARSHATSQSLGVIDVMVTLHPDQR